MKKALKIIVWSAFVFYCLVLLYIFVLDRISHIRPYESIREFQLRVNLIPFKTVYEYIEKIINNRINVDTAITNLIGNIIVFLPMGAFLPCLFQKMRSFKKTVLTVFFIVSSSNLNFAAYALIEQSNKVAAINTAKNFFIKNTPFYLW